jgi:hypothetical protein
MPWHLPYNWRRITEKPHSGHQRGVSSWLASCIQPSLRWVGGWVPPPNQSGRFGKEKYFSPLPGIETRFLECPTPSMVTVSISGVHLDSSTDHNLRNSTSYQQDWRGIALVYICSGHVRTPADLRWLCCEQFVPLSKLKQRVAVKQWSWMEFGGGFVLTRKNNFTVTLVNKHSFEAKHKTESNTSLGT